jgi:hypothetical protein
MLLHMRQASRCSARSKRSGLHRGSKVCRMYGSWRRSGSGSLTSGLCARTSVVLRTKNRFSHSAGVAPASRSGLRRFVRRGDDQCREGTVTQHRGRRGHE